jgi:hypothetical protein
MAEAVVTPALPSDLSSLADPACHALLSRCRSLELPDPDVGFELIKGNRVISDADLAWSDRKIAVLLFDDEGPAFEAAGWRWFLPEEVESVLEVLQGG